MNKELVHATEDFLEHYGVLGMKWGIRKTRSTSGQKKRTKQFKKRQKERAKSQKQAQNEKSVKKTKQEKPKQRTIKDMSDDELRAKISRGNLEKQYRDLYQKPSLGKEFVSKFTNQMVGKLATTASTIAIDQALKMLTTTKSTPVVSTPPAVAQAATQAGSSYIPKHVFNADSALPVSALQQEINNLKHEFAQSGEDFLAHYGVKGMKWGVVNEGDKAGLRRSKSGAVTTTSDGKKPMLGLPEHLKGALEKIRNKGITPEKTPAAGKSGGGGKGGGGKASGSGKATKEEPKAIEAPKQDLDNTLQDLQNKTQALDESKAEAEAVKAKEAKAILDSFKLANKLTSLDSLSDSDVDSFIATYGLDIAKLLYDTGLINQPMYNRFVDRDKGIAQSAIEHGEDFLEHYGVLGMRWGIRKARKAGVIDKQKGKEKIEKVKQLSKERKLIGKKIKGLKAERKLLKNQVKEDKRRLKEDELTDRQYRNTKKIRRITKRVGKNKVSEIKLSKLQKQKLERQINDLIAANQELFEKVA